MDGRPTDGTLVLEVLLSPRQAFDLRNFTKSYLWDEWMTKGVDEHPVLKIFQSPTYGVDG